MKDIDPFNVDPKGNLFNKFKYLSLILLGGLILRLAIEVAIAHGGYFFGRPLDSFSRTILSCKSSTWPPVLKGYWLPFQFWLVGFVFKIIQPLISTCEIFVPVAVNHLFFVFSLAVVFVFTSKSINWHVGLVSLFIIATTAPDIKITFSALSEPLWITTTITIAWLTSEWIHSKSLTWRKALLIGIVAMFGAGVHYFGWFMSLYLALLVIIMFSRLRRLVFGSSWEDGNQKMGPALIMLVLAWLPPLLWFSLQTYQFGNPLYFVEAAGEYQAAFAGQNPFYVRLFSPAIALWKSAPILVTSIFITLPGTLLRHKSLRWFTAPAAFHFLLLTFTAGMAWSAPLQEPRYTVIYLWFGIPLLASWLASDWEKGNQARRLFVALFIVIIAFSGIRDAFQFQNSVDEEIRAVATTIQRWIEDHPSEGKVIVETKSLAESTALPVLAGYPELLSLRSKEQVLHSASDLSSEIEGVKRNVEARQMWVVTSREAIESLLTVNAPADVVGSYIVFEFNQNTQHPESISMPSHWQPLNEEEQFTLVVSDRQLFLGFNSADPPPNAAVGLIRSLQSGESNCSTLKVEIQDPYDSFQDFPGRMYQEIVVGNSVKWSHDLGGEAEPGRSDKGWNKVILEVRDKDPGTPVIIRLRTTDRLEQGWNWGDASEFHLRNLHLTPCLD